MNQRARPRLVWLDVLLAAIVYAVIVGTSIVNRPAELPWTAGLGAALCGSAPEGLRTTVGLRRQDGESAAPTAPTAGLARLNEWAAGGRPHRPRPNNKVHCGRTISPVCPAEQAVPDVARFITASGTAGRRNTVEHLWGVRQ